MKVRELSNEKAFKMAVDDSVFNFVAVSCQANIQTDAKYINYL